MFAARAGLAGLWFILSAVGVQAQTYSVLDLGTLGGSESKAFGVNDSGDVVGQSKITGDGATHAFWYTNGSMSDLGTLGGANSAAFGINGSGDVVGTSIIANGLNSHAFRYTNGSMNDLGTLGGKSSFGHGINSSGDVVGDSTLTGDISSHAFLSTNGGMTDLGTLVGNNIHPTGINSSNSYATSINDSGQIAGYSNTTNDSNFVFHAFLYASGMSDLGTLGGESSFAEGINSSGDVVGRSNFTNTSAAVHAFLYTNGGMDDLGTLGGADSIAYGINDSGDVVGESDTTGDAATHAFLYSEGTMTDLNDLIPLDSGWILISARGINNEGQIVGFGTHNGQTRAFLLTPSQPPPPEGEYWIFNWPAHFSPWTRDGNVFTAMYVFCTWTYTSQALGPWELIQGDIVCADEVPRYAYALITPTHRQLVGVIVQQQFPPAVFLHGRQLVQWQPDETTAAKAAGANPASATAMPSNTTGKAVSAAPAATSAGTAKNGVSKQRDRRR